MGDVNVTVGGDSIEVTVGNGGANVNLGQDVPVHDQYEIKTFTGDDTNQTITFDGNTAREGSVSVYFGGILGNDGNEYDLAVDRQSITLKNSYKTGRQGEVRYVIN